jgi:CRISPR-associated endonuclease/helicase Cas3
MFGNFNFESSKKVLPPINHNDCWGKTYLFSKNDKRPGINVKWHSLYVACVANELIKKFPKLSNKIPKGTLSIFALHDVGKISPGFQFKNQIWKNNYSCDEDIINKSFENNHAIIGYQTLKTHIKNLPEQFCEVVGKHHGTLNILNYKDNCESFGGDVWGKERNNFIQDILNELPLYGLPNDLPQESINQHITDIISGLLCVSDWIASGENFFPPDKPIENPHLVLKIAKEAVEKCGFILPCIIQNLSFLDVFNTIKTFPCNAGVNLGSDVLHDDCTTTFPCNAGVNLRPEIKPFPVMQG